jgi:hypothetical protein
MLCLHMRNLAMQLAIAAIAAAAAAAVNSIAMHYHCYKSQLLTQPLKAIETVITVTTTVSVSLHSRCLYQADRGRLCAVVCRQVQDMLLHSSLHQLL